MDDCRIGNYILIQPIDDTSDLPALITKNNNNISKATENLKSKTKVEKI
jgi:hypothetical protein